MISAFPGSGVQVSALDDNPLASSLESDYPDLGGELELGELDRAGAAAADLLSRPEEFREHIRQVRAREIFNPGHGAEAAGRYIISRLCRDPQQTKRDEK